MSKDNVVVVDRNWWKKEDQSIRGNTVLKPKRKVSEKYYSVEEIATRLNVGTWSIYDYIKRGEMDCVVIGRRKRIPQEALEEFLTKHGSEKTR